MIRRVLIGICAALAVVAPATADDVQRKHQIDARIASLNERVAAAQRKEGALRGQIADLGSQIRVLESRVGDVSTRLVPLERELELRELKLNRLDALFQFQSDRFHFLRAQYAVALDRLNQRLVAIYESPEPTTIDLALSSASFSSFLDSRDYVRQIGLTDERIASAVGTAKTRMRYQLGQTRKTRAVVLAEARIVAVRVAQVRSLRDQLVNAKQGLVSAQADKRQSLATLTAGERAEASEIDALQSVSAQLGERIRATQASSSGATDTTPSAAGLIWPVSGPVTSPFGWRWGRMHTGIDIGVPDGTPIHAAAAGTVIYATWMEGYGNLVVIDHGNGLATAYAHQSQIAVSYGQQVGQGAVIGYVGCTGHCFGPHLHFEVRVNGEPVDPLGYL
jgi:murein DD-endopeptidase MepM/ murein hydrolase activator NlpD